MVDYRSIGTRIRDVRKSKGITQERLAEEVGVGSTHISHIETGVGIASVPTLIDIINALDCSADELLCLEVRKARPFCYEWLEDALADCSDQELKVIKDMVFDLRASMRRHLPCQKQPGDV